MDTLIEAFPFVFGLLLGATCTRFGGLRSHLPAWALGCVALGSLATVTSGEWRVSVLYLFFDIGLVTVVSVATVAALTTLSRRRDVIR